MKRFLTIVLLGIALCFGGLNANADDYFGRSNRNNNFRQQNNNQQQRRIFFNDTFFFGQNGFFDVGDNIKIRDLEDSQSTVKGYLEKMAAQMVQQQQQIIQLQKTIERLQNQGRGGGGLIVPPIFLPPVTPDIPLIPKTETALDTKVTALFENKCSQCHTEGAAKKITLLTRGGALSPLSKLAAGKVHTRTTLTAQQLKARGLKLMPQGGPPLSQAEQDLITAWTNERVGS